MISQPVFRSGLIVMERLEHEIYKNAGTGK